MNANGVWRSYFGILFLVALTFVLINCGVVTEQSELDDSRETINVPPTTAISSSISATRNMISPTALSHLETPEQGDLSLVTPTVTAALLPTPTHTIIPSLKLTVIPCEDASSLPEKVFPAQIDMTESDNQRVAISYPFLYLATEQYLGVFDISDPAAPQFKGFWDFPNWPDISTLQVHKGVAYFTSGSTLIIVNLSTRCQFETVATIEIPFQVFQLEIEGDRLYVDEVSMDMEENHIAIFSIVEPTQPQTLGTVNLSQIAAWSVYEETIYSLGDELKIFDVSDPANPYLKPINLTLDTEVLAHSPSVFQRGKLYLLWEGHTLTIISQLQDETPVIKRNPQRQIVMGDLRRFVYQVSESYIFLGGYSCDVSCGSYVTLFDSMSGQKLSGLGFPDHQSPIHSYHEIQSNIVYAFSDDFLLVIDLSNVAEPAIIAEVKLTT